MRFGSRRKFGGRFSRRGRAQWGIFDFGFGSDETDTEKQEQTDVDRQVREQTTVEQEQTETQRDTTEQVTTQLPEEVQAVLTQLITAGGGGPGAESAEELAALGTELVGRAREAEDLLRQESQTIVSGARTNAERDLERRTTELAAAVGSTQNTFVQQAASEGQAQLEASLAALEAQLGINARSIATDEFQAAMAALTGSAAAGGTSSQGLAQLVNALRGGTVTTVGESGSERVGTSNMTSNRSLDEIVKAFTSGTGSSSSTGFKFGFDL